MDSNINLKNLLCRIWELKQGINEVYDWVKHGLGEDANYIHDWADFRRVSRDDVEGKELEGDALFDEVIQYIWQSGKDYVWHYKGQRFRITPFKSGTTDDGGYIFYFGEQHSLVNFGSIVRDAVDTECSIWEAIVARMHGIADGYLAGLKHNVEEDLKWKDGYSVDPAEAVKVPEGADDGTAWNRPMEEEEFDGCLREAVAQAEAEETVIDQADGRLIRAGGPSPQRYG